MHFGDVRIKASVSAQKGALPGYSAPDLPLSRLPRVAVRKGRHREEALSGISLFLCFEATL